MTATPPNRTNQPSREPGLASRLFRMVGSFGFATILLLFLLLLTWLGTLEQIEHGLFEVQKKYFDSLGLVHWAGPWQVHVPFSDSVDPLFTVPSIPVPLPGVYLVLSLLMLNLLVGGIVRLKKDVRRSGILIAHLGIVLLLAAGFVKYRWSVEGNLRLWPREFAGVVKPDDRSKEFQSDEFQSFFEWEVAIREAVEEGVVREYLIPNSDWEDLDEGRSRQFKNDALPFDLTVTRWFRNCQVVPKGPMFQGDGPVIDGYVVLKSPPNPEAEGNAAGLYVTCTEKASGKQTDAILCGDVFRDELRSPAVPFTLAAGGKSWLIELRKKRMKLPFTVRLDHFDFAMHPGTGTARFFTSDVTKFEGGREQSLKITMNEPLRHQGFTLYQASYGPNNVEASDEHYSQFEVVSNPSDQWPKWACWVIAAGLALHFAMKLFKYVESEQRRTRS